MKITKLGKNLLVTTIAVASLGTGLAMSQGNASAAVNERLKDELQYGAPDCLKDIAQSMKDTYYDAANDKVNTYSEQDMADFKDDYQYAWKYVYGVDPFTNNNVQAAPAASANTNNNAQATPTTSVNTNTNVAANNANTTQTNNQQFTSANTQTAGVNTQNVAKGTELPQTGNDNNGLMVAFGALAGMFGLGLAANKREF